MAGGSTFTWSHALRLDSTKSPFDSPIPSTHQAFADVKPISWKRYNIAGILTTIYGIQELSTNADRITILWLLHGRGDTQDSMSYTAAALLDAWKRKRQNTSQPDCICITFDQRNHGSRMIENENNISWKQGNPSHGPDMFSVYVGTAHDLTLLITQIPAYLPFKIHDHICAGVSLGGHATWVALMKEPRISAGIVVIGCPDYVRLMTDRAIRSKVSSAIRGNPPGSEFLGSEHFPPPLLAAIEQYDPAGILWKEMEVGKQMERFNRTLAGKKILCLSGGKDKLVPYDQAKPFLTWLKHAIGEDGWAQGRGLEVEDILDPEAGHEFSSLMRREAERWICDVLSDDERLTVKESKL
jgi:pimeloyl-ACP methyl ester carboxylesterase